MLLNIRSAWLYSLLIDILWKSKHFIRSSYNGWSTSYLRLRIRTPSLSITRSQSSPANNFSWQTHSTCQHSTKTALLAIQSCCSHPVLDGCGEQHSWYSDYRCWVCCTNFELQAHWCSLRHKWRYFHSLFHLCSCFSGLSICWICLLMCILDITTSTYKAVVNSLLFLLVASLFLSVDSVLYLTNVKSDPNDGNIVQNPIPFLVLGITVMFSLVSSSKVHIEITCTSHACRIYINKYKNNYKKLFREVGMAVPKRKGTRVGWWLLM